MKAFVKDEIGMVEPSPTAIKSTVSSRAVRQASIVMLAAVSIITFSVLTRSPSSGVKDSPFVVAAGATTLLWIVRCTRADDRQRKTPGIGWSTSSLTLVFVASGFVFPALLVYLFGISPVDRTLKFDYDRPGQALWLINVFWSFAYLTQSFFSQQSRGLLGLNGRSLSPRYLRYGFVVGFFFSLVNLLQRGRSIDGRIPLPTLLAPFEQVISNGVALTYLAIAGLASMGSGRERRAAVVMATLVALVGMADGFFKPTLWAVVALVLGHALSPKTKSDEGSTSKRLVLASLTIGIAVVAIVPIVQADRGTDTTGSIVNDLRDGYERSWGAGLGTGWEIFVDKSLGRQAGIYAGMTRVVGRVPDETNFRGFDELAFVPTALIPRAIWTSKPNLSTGTQVSVEFYDQAITTTSSSSLLAIGDAFWFRGLTAVVIVAMLMGAMFGYVDTRLSFNAAAASRIALIPFFVDIEDGVAQWFNGAIKSLLVVSVFAYLASRPTTDSPVDVAGPGRKQGGGRIS